MTTSADNWERVVRQHFGNRLGRHSAVIEASIRAVDGGLKPSYLWDAFLAQAATIGRFIGQLKSEGKIRNDLVTVTVDRDNFVLLLNEVLRLKSARRPTLVDVSRSLEQPVLSDAEVTERVNCQVDHVLSQLEMLTSPLAGANNNGGSNGDVVELELLPQWNVSTLFGLLLNYPVVYWYDACTGGGNESCLVMRPLRVYTVTAKMNKGADGSRPVSVLYSFSVPERLGQVVGDGVNLWFTELQAKFKCQTAFVDLKMCVSTVTLPSVAL